MPNILSTTLLEPSTVESDDLIYRITVDMYHHMIEAGAFHPEADIELIHGLLIKKMPKSRLHAKVTQQLMVLLIRLLGLDQGWFLSIQDPITLEDSEPEPDIAIIRGSVSDYDRHPGPDAIGLVIEIADSSIDYDTVVKQRLYGLNGVPVYWIVNLQERSVQIYTNPDQNGYRQKETFTIDDQLPLSLDSTLIDNIDVASLF